MTLKATIEPQICADFRGFKCKVIKLQEKAFHQLGEIREFRFRFKISVNWRKSAADMPFLG